MFTNSSKTYNARQKARQILCGVALFLLPFGLSGCEWLDDLRQNILVQGEKTVVNVADQAKKTKESVEQKINDVKRAATEVQQAAKEVNEAIEAVKKVTGETPTAEATASTEAQTSGTTTSKKQVPSLAD